ncbi:MAG TPA: DUF3060 domain-containing protein [Tahibacter sp.]|nr:DUF3060 domain-containing protein [Tahibacter sp.]
MTTYRILPILFLAAVATAASADDRIAAKAPGVEAEMRGDGSVSVKVDVRDGEQWLSLEDSRQAGTIACKGRHVSISGKRNRLTLTGDCPFLDVSGDGNEITVEALGELSLAGDGNRVAWKRAVVGGAPEVSDSGDDNVVKRAD